MAAQQLIKIEDPDLVWIVEDAREYVLNSTKAQQWVSKRADELYQDELEAMRGYRVQELTVQRAWDELFLLIGLPMSVS